MRLITAWSWVRFPPGPPSSNPCGNSLNALRRARTDGGTDPIPYTPAVSGSVAIQVFFAHRSISGVTVSVALVTVLAALILSEGENGEKFEACTTTLGWLILGFVIVFLCSKLIGNIPASGFWRNKIFYGACIAAIPVIGYLVSRKESEPIKMAGALMAGIAGFFWGLGGLITASAQIGGAFDQLAGEPSSRGLLPLMVSALMLIAGLMLTVGYFIGRRHAA